MSRFAIRFLIVAAILVAVVGTSLFAVDETQIAVVTKFGRPIKVIQEPGLHVKLPSPFASVLRFDKRIMVYEPLPSEFLTEDKKNILTQTFACWRIRDVQKFLETVKTREGAELRIGDTIRSELGSSLGMMPLTALVSTNPELVKLDEIMGRVTANSAEKTLRNYGIELVSVSLKRINFPDQNKASVYERMRSERARIAKKYRAEGNEQAAMITAETDKEVSRILSEAYRTAEKVKGEGDAEAAKIYAEAYNRDPQFYKKLRTLEAYRKFLDEKTTVVLSTDSELLQFLAEGIGQ